MYNKLLVPLDGSKTAEHVLPFVRLLARNLQVPVELLAVVDAANMQERVSPSDGLFLDSIIEDEIRRLAKYLQQVARNFPTGATQCRVEHGRPAEVIIAAAGGDKSTMIGMATHGRSGLQRWLMGSVAEKVLRGSSNPVLLARATEKPPDWGMAALKSVVVPLDGSELAERVLPPVEVLAGKCGLEVILLRVYGVPHGAYSAGEGFYDPTHMEQFVAVLRNEASDYLERKAAELRNRGIKNVSYLVKEGFASDEIITVARHTAHNLVAMCSHGRSGVQRWALGSVTETVVRHSGDPVLIARATD